MKHYKMAADGLPIAEGCRLWNAEIAGWPEETRNHAIDGRGTSLTMRPEAYRRLLSREEYCGNFAYGRKRNRWLDGKEQVIQEDAPEREVSRQHREHLRIVPDELFYQVQERLAGETRGKHGPRLDKESPLSSSLIELFKCAECGHDFYSYGTRYMHCPNSTRGECGSWGTVEREVAVEMLLSALRNQILSCTELTTEIVEQSRKLDAAANDGRHAERVAALEKSIKRQGNMLLNIAECYADTGMDAEAKQRAGAVKREKMRLEAELAMLMTRRDEKRQPITEKRVMELLKGFETVLTDAGAGNLGPEEKQRAVALIRLLTGDKVTVSFTRLEGRRRAFGVGVFTPRPLSAFVEEGGLNREVVIPFPEVRLEFRELPRYARIADDVYRLYGEGMSMTEIGSRFNCKSGNVWEAYAYWHTSRGLEVPIKREGMKNRRTAAK